MLDLKLKFDWFNHKIKRIWSWNAIDFKLKYASLICNSEESVNFRTVAKVISQRSDSQQAYSAKFQAEMTIDKRVLKKLKVKTRNAIFSQKSEKIVSKSLICDVF